MSEVLLRSGGRSLDGRVGLWRSGCRSLDGEWLRSPGSGGAPAAPVGGAALLTGEANGFAVDFLYAADARRVAVKASSVVTEYAVDGFFANTGTSPKQVYDASGLLVWSPHNMLLRSHEFDNASWAKVAATIGADAVAAPVVAGGSGSADAFIPNSGLVSAYLSQAPVIQAGETYVFSVYAKNGGLGTDWLQLEMRASATYRAWFNLATGTKGSATGGAAWNIVSLPGGWYRLDMSVVSTATPCTCFLLPRLADNSTANITGDGVLPAFYCWGGQLNRGSVPLAYLPTTSAARVGLALDYDPVTHAARGLLGEPAATNLLLRSSEFDNVSWGRTNLTATANAVAAPNGLLEGDKLIENAGSGSKVTFMSVAATTGIFSVYAKAAERSRIVLLDNTAAKGDGFNLSAAGAIFVSAGVTPTGGAVVQSVGNGWYRCSIPTVVSTDVRIFLHNGTSAAYTGDGVSGAYVWGAQLETGSIATSPIPTYAASVTRVVDNYTCTPAQINQSPTAGSWWAEWVAKETLANARVINHSAGTATPLMHNVNKCSLYAGTTLEASVVWTPGQINRHASAFTTSDRAVTGNGGAVAADAGVVTNLLAPGANIFWGALHHGWIRKAYYLPRRMSNAELVTKTT